MNPSSARRRQQPVRRLQPPGGARDAQARRRTVPRGAQRLRRTDPRAYQQAAQLRLRRFRQGTALAVAITALLLLVWGGSLEVAGQQTPAQQETADPLPADPAAAVDQAAGTIRELAFSFYAFLPQLILVGLLFVTAALLTRVVRWGLDRGLREWERREAASALTRLIAYVAATVAAVSVLAGDARAVAGSVGLLGLAASWALQTPIESFTGWLLNSFRGYYRVGDRIAVGDVFGDVYRIDVLTTTVWEAGGPGKPVAAAQATGALITFPNWEVLRSNVVNYSRDFPYVWDEITINVANGSDLAYTVEVLQATARRVLGEQMQNAVEQYQRLLAAERLAFDVDEIPRVYLSLADSWTDCTVRYLVPVRSRRVWSSALVLEITREMSRDPHKGKILPVYPRTEVKLWADWPGEEAGSGK